MREWLTIIIVLLIIGIVLDGIRRMRQTRKNNIRMSLTTQQSVEKEETEAFGSELPSGGARIVSRVESEAKKVHKSVNANAADSLPEQRPFSIPKQVSLNLAESVPMLMESIDEVDRVGDDLSLGSGRIEPKLTEADPIWEAKAGVHTDSEPSPTQDTASLKAQHKQPQQEKTQKKAKQGADEVLIINIMASKGHIFNGTALLDNTLACGMWFGAMDIFHCHETEQGDGEILFSMANIVVPGTFDLDKMQHFETPGVSLFLTLPLTCDSLMAFNRMLTTAETLCEKLDGELKDENRSAMTQQTIEHYRQRIRDFERKQLSKTLT